MPETGQPDLLHLVAMVHDARSDVAALVALLHGAMVSFEDVDREALQRLAWARDDLRDAYAALDRCTVALRALI